MKEKDATIAIQKDKEKKIEKDKEPSSPAKSKKLLGIFSFGHNEEEARSPPLSPERKYLPDNQDVTLLNLNSSSGSLSCSSQNILNKSSSEDLTLSGEFDNSNIILNKMKKKKKKKLRKGAHSLLVLSSVVVCKNINFYKGKYCIDIPADIQSILLKVMIKFNLLDDINLGFFLNENEKKLNLQLFEKLDKLTDISLSLISACCPTLEQLSLGRWNKISNEGISQYCEHAPKTLRQSLTHLSLCEISKISCDFFPIMTKKFKNISSLDFSFSLKLKVQDLIVLSDSYAGTLKELRLRGIILKNEEISVISNRFRAIEVLDLSVPIFNPKKIYATPEVIAEIANLGKTLTKLYLCGLQFNDQSITNIVTNCPKLQTLDLSYMKSDQIYYVNITEVSVRAIADNCKDLLELGIARCNRITKEKSIIYLINHLSQLEKLNLSGLDCVTDKTVIAISQFCLNMKRLKLQNCLFSTHSVSCIGESCSALQYLDLRSNSVINDAAFDAIAKGCPKLENLLAFMSPIARLNLQLHCENLKLQSKKKETMAQYCSLCFADRED